MFIRSKLALVIGLMTVLPMVAHSQVPEALKGVRRIVCLGDSITEGGERPGGYVWLFRHYLGAIYPNTFEVRNAGISGNKSTDMRARFQRDVLDFHPDLVTISVGVNDVWHGFYDNHPKGDGPLGIPLSDYRQNVEWMISQATAAHAKVVLLSATLIQEDVESAENKKALDYNRALAEIASERGLPFVNLQSAFRNIISAYRRETGSTRNFLTVDGVHMNAQGNQLMADCILHTLGVPEPDLAKAHDGVMREMESKPVVTQLPSGQIVSVGKPASASSETPGYGASEATLPYIPGSSHRWCAKDGSFSPPQWWMVDLGDAKELTGICLLFAPEEPDTWKYRLEISSDGKSYESVVDATHSDEHTSATTHVFSQSKSARFVRVVFTDNTSARNWASLRNVMVFAK